MFGFVASTTSSTPFRSTRPSSSSMRRCSGSTPSIGESAPPSTWYRPRYSCVRSSESRSAGCSTTQTIVWSRRASRQISQVSSSVRFPHSRQKRTRSLTSAIAAASAPASSFGTRRRWNASRCAVRCPTPGRRVSCATRLSTEGLNTSPLCPPGLRASRRRLLLSSVGALQRLDLELAHLQHRAHHALRLLRIGVADQLQEDGRHDLPRDSVLVLQPAARSLLAAFRELLPQLVDLFLRLAIDHERH